MCTVTPLSAPVRNCELPQDVVGDAPAVIATDEHRAAFWRQLNARGLHIDGALEGTGDFPRCPRPTRNVHGGRDA
jgi:hypothetical protein